MNPTEIKNVTPTGGTVAVATASKRSVNTSAIVLGAILVFVVLLGYKLFHHHRSAYEATADAVTIAIVNNNMTPVEHKFNAIRLPELEDRARVGRLSNMLVPLGAFKGSKEITPPNSDAGLHEFTESFANGTKFEKYELDADGKIAKFFIGDPPSTSTAP